jgi:hypothetical protein
MRNESEDILRIACEIENYLSAHPRGTDTLTGVLNWWIPKQRYIEAKERVEKALDYLVREGKVHRVRKSDGTSLYSKAESDDGKPPHRGQC